MAGIAAVFVLAAATGILSEAFRGGNEELREQIDGLGTPLQNFLAEVSMCRIMEMRGLPLGYYHLGEIPDGMLDALQERFLRFGLRTGPLGRSMIDFNLHSSQLSAQAKLEAREAFIGDLDRQIADRAGMRHDPAFFRGDHVFDRYIAWGGRCPRLCFFVYVFLAFVGLPRWIKCIMLEGKTDEQIFSLLKKLLPIANQLTSLSTPVNRRAARVIIRQHFNEIFAFIFPDAFDSDWITELEAAVSVKGFPPTKNPRKRAPLSELNVYPSPLIVI